MDFTAARRWLQHTFEAASRRWLLSLALVSLCVAAAVAGALMKPILYAAHARILATPTEGAPGTMSGTSNAAAGLSPAVVEELVSKDALLKLSNELHLLERFESTRTPAQRFKTALREKLLSEPVTTLAREEALVTALREWIYVKVDGQSVDIGATFPDKAAARDIVEALRVKVIASRREAELATFEATLKEHRSHVQRAEARVQSSVAELQAHLAKKRKGSKAATVKSLQQEGSFGELPDPKLMQLRTEILVIRKTVQELEASRSKRMAELNALLADQQGTLGPQHPTLLETKEKLAAVQTPGPELTALREREQRLVASFVEGGGRDSDLLPDPGPLFTQETLAEDANAQYLRSRIALESSELQDAYREEAAAAVALASRQAQFPQRYATLKPPTPEKDPVSRPFWQWLLSGFAAGLVLALFAAVVLDAREGRVRHAWQLEQALRLPVLATVPLGERG